MTEPEWLASTHPDPMIAHISDSVSERKLRRFTSACCRRVWHLLPRPRREFRRLLELSRRVAREQPPDPARAKLYAAAAASCAAFAAAAAENNGPDAEALAAHAVYAAAALTGAGYADEEATVWSVAADAAAADHATRATTERAAQADLIRMVVGNPFRNPRRKGDCEPGPPSDRPRN